VVGEEPTQAIWLGPGNDQQLIFGKRKQPLLTIRKVDAANSTTPIPNAVFTLEGVDSGYQHDVTTGADGTGSLRVAPDGYQITEKSVPAPYFLPDKDADRVQSISFNAGDKISSQAVCRDNDLRDTTNHIPIGRLKKGGLCRRSTVRHSKRGIGAERCCSPTWTFCITSEFKIRK